MINRLPSRLAKTVYIKSMENYDKVSLIIFIEHMWTLFSQVLELCFNNI